MNELVLAQIKIVLVEPAGDRNVGSVARILKNMGLSQLILVNPQCDSLSTEARHMAVHGVDVLESAQIVSSLPEALSGCQQAIATVGRDCTIPLPLEPPRTALPSLLTAPSALIFGREDRGLTNQELNLAHRLVRIPSSDTYPSLNLAQAVAICAYELYQSLETSPVSTSPEIASLEALEGYYHQLETLLLKIGYLHPHTCASRMEKFRLLFNRTRLTPSEVAMLRGILSQMNWAIHHWKPSPESDRD